METSAEQAAPRPGQPPEHRPAWYCRQGGSEVREAFRLDPSSFPFDFLMIHEYLRWSNPRRGVSIGRIGSEINVGLSVPPGYWVLRNEDGDLNLWRDDKFRLQWVRATDREWTPPAERDNPHLGEADVVVEAGRPPGDRDRRAAPSMAAVIAKECEDADADSRRRFARPGIGKMHPGEAELVDPLADRARRVRELQAGEFSHADSEGVAGPRDRLAVWGCKIGVSDRSALPDGADSPLRQAVEDAYRELTGRNADFCFSGWGEELTPAEAEDVRALAQTEREVQLAKHTLETPTMAPPAGGTRRKLILDTIGETLGDCEVVVKSDFEGDLPLVLANKIEEVLFKVVDQGTTLESGSPASVAMDLLDRFEIPRTREGAILTIAHRVTALADELVEARRERDVRQATLEGLAATVSAQADELQRRVDALAKLTLPPAAGNVPAGTKELRVILVRNPDPAEDPEYLFVEIEDQDGNSIGGFERRDDAKGTFEIVIPYGRDDEWVQQVVMAAVQAGHDSDVPFPGETVDQVLQQFGVKPSRPRIWPPGEMTLVGEGAQRVGESNETPKGDDPRDGMIKYLEGELERILGGREEARTRESRFAEERDSAFALLRWLLPVTVARRID